MITLVYRHNDQVINDGDMAALPGLLERGQTLWLDLQSPTEAEFGVLTEVFRFHPLAVEDATHPIQRPKVDEYPGYAFLTADEVVIDFDAYAPTRSPSGPDKQAIRTRQIAAFLGESFLVTIHTEPTDAIRELCQRCDHHELILSRGADFILYSLLDALVDRYFPLLDALEDRMDDLEDRIIGHPEQSVLDTIFSMKRDLARLRRHTGPLREVLQSLTSRDFPGIHAETTPYLRDVADHLFRVYEALDGYRDLMSNMLDAYLSQVSNELNRVMQKLSVVATVFLPISFLAGVLGMNFEKMPWFRTDANVWIAVMVGMAVMTYMWFKRRHWV